METPQDWTAKLISDNANEAFKKDKRNFISKVVKISG